MPDWLKSAAKISSYPENVSWSKVHRFSKLRLTELRQCGFCRSHENSAFEILSRHTSNGAQSRVVVDFRKSGLFSNRRLNVVISIESTRIFPARRSCFSLLSTWDSSIMSENRFAKVIRVIWLSFTNTNAMSVSCPNVRSGICRVNSLATRWPLNFWIRIFLSFDWSKKVANSCIFSASSSDLWMLSNKFLGTSISSCSLNSFSL